METRLEVNRLKEVYREYGERGWRNTKWAVTNRGNQAILQERKRKLEHLLRLTGFLPLDNKRILDVGCGAGETLAGLTDWGARPGNLFGVDLLADRILCARANFPGMAFQETNAEALPFADGFFDLVTVFTVFTSILDSRMARNVSWEINRVLRPGGAAVWYDFRMNNPFNRHVRGIPREGIQSLFPGFDLRLVAITLVPPLARRWGRLTDLVYPCFVALPFLRSHYLGVLIKP